MDQQGVSTTLSELGLPTPSGKFGSMNMVGNLPCHAVTCDS